MKNFYLCFKINILKILEKIKTLFKDFLKFWFKINKYRESDVDSSSRKLYISFEKEVLRGSEEYKKIISQLLSKGDFYMRDLIRFKLGLPQFRKDDSVALNVKLSFVDPANNTVVETKNYMIYRDDWKESIEDVGPEGARVGVHLSYVDNAGNVSEMTYVEYTLLDYFKPAAPDLPTFEVVGEEHVEEEVVKTEEVSMEEENVAEEQVEEVVVPVEEVPVLEEHVEEVHEEGTSAVEESNVEEVVKIEEEMPVMEEHVEEEVVVEEDHPFVEEELEVHEEEMVGEEVKVEEEKVEEVKMEEEEEEVVEGEHVEEEVNLEHAVGEVEGNVEVTGEAEEGVDEEEENA